jgi:hypothetical protein
MVTVKRGLRPGTGEQMAKLCGVPTSGSRNNAIPRFANTSPGWAWPAAPQQTKAFGGHAGREQRHCLGTPEEPVAWNWSCRRNNGDNNRRCQTGVAALPRTKKQKQRRNV